MSSQLTTVLLDHSCSLIELESSSDRGRAPDLQGPEAAMWMSKVKSNLREHVIMH